MSTAKFDTLQNAAGSKSVPVSTVVDGSAKAWVAFNGTGTVAISGAFNCTSITDVAVGQYVVNLTTALTDTNFSAVGAINTFATSGGIMVAGARTTSSLSVNTVSNGAFFDTTHVQVAIFR